MYYSKNAAKEWFELIRDNLINDKEDSLNFKQRKLDPCLFYKENCVLLIYVDHCLLFVEDKSVAKKIMDHLKDLNFEKIDKGSVFTYLTVDVTKVDDDTYTLIQSYLIQLIIEALGYVIKDANTKTTPAFHIQLLSKELKGSERKQDWNY